LPDEIFALVAVSINKLLAFSYWLLARVWRSREYR